MQEGAPARALPTRPSFDSVEGTVPTKMAQAGTLLAESRAIAAHPQGEAHTTRRSMPGSALSPSRIG
jgi:hypothetical protein